MKVRVNVGVWPVPLSATLCGLPVALSVNEMDAVRVPAAVGLNVALTEQAEPAVRLAAQVLPEMAKSPAFVPANAMFEKVTVPLPVLVMVTLCAALVVPVF